MKTNLLKLNLTVAVLGLAMGAIAQTGNQNKTHIKINEIINGKVINIDTTFTGLSETEITKQLSAMNINAMPEVNDISADNLLADAGDAGTPNVKARVIIINNDDNNSIESTNASDVKGGSGCTVVVDNDGDTFTTTGDSGVKTKIIVKKYVDGKNTEMNIYCKIVKVENVSNKMDSPLKTDVAANSRPFSELKVYPNPAEATLNILYKQVGSAPMVITIYDANGKSVYTETVNDKDERVSKSISLSSLGAGIYFVQLAQGNQTEVKKVVVK